MRIVDLGNGAVAFEPFGTEDNVGSLDGNQLIQSGWSQEAVSNYLRYRDGSHLLGWEPGQK